MKKKAEVKKIEDFKEKQRQRELAVEAAKADHGKGYKFNSGHGGFSSSKSAFGDDDIVSMIIKFVGKFF